MTKTFHPDRLDVKAFAQAGGHLAGHETLLKYERLAEEAQGLHPDLRVDWYADAELRTDAGSAGCICAPRPPFPWCVSAVCCLWMCLCW